MLARSNHNFFFKMYAALFTIAAMYHIIGLIIPDEILYLPRWRHGLFVIVDVILVFITLHRTKWSLLIIGVITLQQIYSHGTRAWTWYTNDQIIDWISIVIIILLPFLNMLLFTHLKEHRNVSTT